jgi:hypothetical protein
MGRWDKHKTMDKHAPHHSILTLVLALTGLATGCLAGCEGDDLTVDTSPATLTPVIREPTTAQDINGWWQPKPGTTWQWQLSGEINTSYDVDMYDVDLFDTPQTIVDELRAADRVVICYFSAGSYEDWRPDADDFPQEAIGKRLVGWPGERWLDIRDIDGLAPVMNARLVLAVDKGCDGVEPDNVDGYANNSGFPLTADDQIAYNRWLAAQAHTLGLSIGLKNALALIPSLVNDFDWALNEQCFEYEECETLEPFIESGKAVFGVEYEGDPSDYCPQAVERQFSWLTKTYDLGDEPPGACE